MRTGDWFVVILKLLWITGSWVGGSADSLRLFDLFSLDFHLLTISVASTRMHLMLWALAWPLCDHLQAQRKIPRVPFKVLDAPELQDDFYLNLVDWSSQNMLSVGLGSCVYLWSASTSQVVRLCDLSQESDAVTSVSWSDRVSSHK